MTPRCKFGNFLGLDCGGTRTVALHADDQGRTLARVEFGPANVRLLTNDQLFQHFQNIAQRFPEVEALGIGMAGARTDADRKRIVHAAAQAWPGIPAKVSHDLEIALAAAEPPASVAARVLVLSGTGSCCHGRNAKHKTAKVGGWGHILGDKGSGFEIGLRALKAVVYYLDRDTVWSRLGQRLLRKLHLNRPDDLIAWVQTASKTEVAALTLEVFTAASQGDRIARDVLEGAADSLARDAACCAQQLARPGQPVQFVLAGSVLLKQPKFARRVGREIQRCWRGAKVNLLEREPVWGAIELARSASPGSVSSLQAVRSVEHAKAWTPNQAEPASNHSPVSPTEQRNPRSMNLDRLSIAAAVELMVSEDQKIPPAILQEKQAIQRAIGFIVKAFKSGGRLIYVGAGTSGRLGVLDASECPPTFRTPPEQVQAIMAGGPRAICESIEGAEDEDWAGAQAIEFRGVNVKDVVVGIAASGRTPFVWGALLESRRRQAKTVLLCCNPFVEIPKKNRPNVVIAPNLGPELLTGSTRLKSGTATKLILNMFTTIAMVKTGKVVSNLMVDLNPSNVKLRARAIRILRDLTGMDDDDAQKALVAAHWVIQDALKEA